jgi:glycosyltransferase involved in cell wall biosynthesis
MKKLKILFLADHKSPHTRRWAEWLSRRGHHVAVFTLNRLDRLDATGMLYEDELRIYGGTRPPSRLYRSLLGVFRYIKCVKHFNPDIVHAHSTGSYAWLTIVARARVVLVTPWGKDLVEDLRPNFLSFLLTKIALLLSHYVTTDGAHLVKILARLGLDERKIFRHEWGVDTEFFQPNMRTLGNRPDRPLTVISTRTLTPVHNVDVLIRAGAVLQNSGARFVFKIIGDGSEMASLKKMAQTLSLNNIEFCGMLNQYQLLNALQEADIYVSTSPVDAGLSVSTAEAMSCGLPVLHPNVADNADWTPNGEGGYLFQPGSFTQLAELLNLMALNTECLPIMGSRNRQTICFRNSMNDNMGLIESLYLKAYEEYC